MDGWERLGALAVQVGLTMMVCQAFVQGARWWWYALSAHTLVDFTTVGLVRLVTPVWGQGLALVATESLVTIYGILAIWVIRRVPEAHSAL